MPKTNIDQAWSVWTQSSGPDETTEALRARAEAQILDQKPETPKHAVMILEVLLDNLRAGSRTDERDLGALARLTAFMRGLDQDDRVIN
ncbi:hypothetical protein [Brevundimonas sp. GCM10030266]|jgi:hypothetical protein|uniref:hypothetical protein n=1 Tax=Brevundimonas sp. GCM10030266 TaxID=3273386 RepID=UPI00360EC540